MDAFCSRGIRNPGKSRLTRIEISAIVAAQTPAPAASLGNPFQFKARPYLPYAGGIYDVRARYWAPNASIFLSIDEFAFDDPRGTLWSWPGQNPVMYRDPSGRCPMCVGAAIGAGVGALGYGAYAAYTGNFSWTGLALATAGGAVVGGTFGLGYSALVAGGTLTAIEATSGAAGAALVNEAIDVSENNVGAVEAEVENICKIEQTYGPYTHLDNRGAVDIIRATNQLLSTTGRYGDEAVRASNGPAPPDGFVSEKAIIEFTTSIAPTFNPGQNCNVENA